MKNYLIVESDGVSHSSFRGMELALELAERGCHIKLWLVQDAVQLFQFKIEEFVKVHCLLKKCISSNNIEIYIDQFALEQRGCSKTIISNQEIAISEIDLLSLHLMEKDAKAIWH